MGHASTTKLEEKRSKAREPRKPAHEVPQLRQSGGAPAGLPRFLQGSAGGMPLNNEQTIGILLRSAVESAMGMSRPADRHEREAEGFASGGLHFAEAPTAATRNG